MSEKSIERFDVVIVGAGLAGTSLAYHLSEACPDKRVLILDKNEIGANCKHSNRIVAQDTKDAVAEYGLRTVYRHKGVKLGTFNEIYATLDGGVYVIDFKDTCSSFFKKSSAEFRKEKAVALKKDKILVTDKAAYQYSFLIDCSATSFFLRKQLGLSLPFRYWIGVKKYSSPDECSVPIDRRYYYNLMEENNLYLYEYLYNGQALSYCKWQNAFSKDIETVTNKEGQRGYRLRRIKEPFVEQKDFVGFPGNPLLPLVVGNCAFLGDSAGTTPPQSGFGVDMSLKCAKMLTDALSKNDLDYYQKTWKRTFYQHYLRHLAARIDRSSISPALQKLKNYPGLDKVCAAVQKNPDSYFSLIRNNMDFSVPKEVKECFPSRRALFLLYHYAEIRARYLRSRITDSLSILKRH